MAKLNVAQMVFSKAIGGAEAVACEIAHHLDPAAFNVLVITNDEIRSAYEGGAVTVLSVGSLEDSFPTRRMVKLLNRICPSVIPRRTHSQSVARRVARFLEDHHIDVLHTHLGFDQYLASKLRVERTKQVMTVHGVVYLDIPVRHPMHPALLRRVLGSADRLTSACRYFVGRLEAHGIAVRNRITVIENGIDRELMDAKREPVNRDSRLTMTFLGGTRPAKGGDMLVQALDIVVHEHRVDQVHLDILREVPRDSALYSHIHARSLQDYVTLAGYVSDNEHLRYISRNKLFVLPSLTEGMAHTLMEAVGLDKPILATAVGGTPEIVEHGRNGYLCDTTAESLAEGILFFARNPEKLDEYGGANGQLKARYLWPTVVQRYERLYQALAAGDASRPDRDPLPLPS